MLDHSATLERVLHALADPTRRAMIERLARGPASVKELARPLPMSLAAVVQHLQVLEASALVRTEKNGRVRTCQLNPDGLRLAEDWVRHQRTSWEQKLDSLGEFFTEADKSTN